VQLIRLVDEVPEPPAPPRRGRGRPVTYPEKLFLKILLFMILRRLYKIHEVYSVLSLPTADAAELRGLLFPGQMPCERTFERRLAKLPERLPAQICWFGLHLLQLYNPWRHCGRAAAIDSTAMKARGAPWHQKDRKKGIVPNTSIDTEAHWTRSGWHGWVYGWKLHVVIVIADIWIPLAARLRPANEADNVVAEELLGDIPAEARFILADSQYNTEALHQATAAAGHTLVASSRGRSPRSNSGVEVRKIFHGLRSHGIENFNSLFKAIFNLGASVPTKGAIQTERCALGALFAYQIALLYRFHSGEHHQRGIKALLRSA
jgi:hypothetical protein